MTRSNRALSEKGTIVRSNLPDESRSLRHAGRTSRLLARCPIGRGFRHRPANAKPTRAKVAAGTETGRERLAVGILTLIAVGYGVALLSRIVVQYAL